MTEDTVTLNTMRCKTMNSFPCSVFDAARFPSRMDGIYLFYKKT